MRYDLKSGFETFAGAAVAGGVYNAFTQHPANPVPAINWYVSGGVTLAGLLLEGLGSMTRGRLFHETGEGMFAAGSAQISANLLQLGRNKLAAKAAATPPAAPAPTNYVLPAPSYTGADSLGDF